MSVSLKPCPWCGSSDIDADHGAWGVICNQCHATGPGRCHHDTSYWNTRTPDPAVAVLEAEVARLRDALRMIELRSVGILVPQHVGETIRHIAGSALNPAPSVQHFSDCVVHNEPAYPNGLCDCGGIPAPSEKGAG